MTHKTFGMIRQENVRKMLARVLPLFGQGIIAVIRSIDSTRASKDLGRILDFHHVEYDAINNNVYLSLEELRKALVGDVFTGFDEVWILYDKPPPMDLNPLPSVTSDATKFSEGVPEELTEAMAKTNGLLIIGDGCGLNYITSDKRLEEEITKTEA